MKIFKTILITTLLTLGAYAHHNSPADNAGNGMPEDSMHNFIFAHHNSGSDSAGGNINDGSGHLDLFLAHHNSPSDNAGRGMPDDSGHMRVFG